MLFLGMREVKPFEALADARAAEPKVRKTDLRVTEALLVVRPGARG
jgi:hypothetical protein